MSRHDPNRAPEPDDWLSLDEGERIDAVVEYHQRSGQEEPESGWDSHATLHCLVETQIAEGTPNVRETMVKLMRQGLSRHDAIHAVAAVAGEEMRLMMRDHREFDQKRYRRQLDKLTAKRWLKGKVP